MTKQGRPNPNDGLPSASSPRLQAGEERAEVRLLKQRKKRDNALCLFVLGILGLILGAVFFVLSFRYNFLRERLFVPGSLEFVTCILFLSSGAVCLVWGVLAWIFSERKMRRIRSEKE